MYKVGDKIKFNRVYVKGEESELGYFGLFKGEVIQLTKYHMTMRVKPDHDELLRRGGNPENSKPYNISLTWDDVRKRVRRVSDESESRLD